MSDAPGPRFQPAQVTTRAGVSSVWAPGDDDDLVDRALLQALQDLGQQKPLLRCAEAGRLSGGEDDRSDAHCSSTVTDSITTGRVGCSVAGSPSSPIRSTTSSPLVTLPTMA